MASKRYNKVRKYRRPLNINIGVIIFGIIFIYICFSVGHYIFRTKITAYEVQKGSLAKDNTYTGFAIREEMVVNTDAAGYVNYYAREGEKIGANQAVYTVSQSADLNTLLGASSENKSNLSKENLSTLKKEVQSFSTSFTPKDFSKVYDFKYSMETTVLELVNANLLDNLSQSASNGSAAFRKETAKADGILVYSTDGYEGVTADTFKPDMLKQENYKKTKLQTTEVVNAGTPVYKEITSENWIIIIPLDTDTAAKLKDKDSINIKFKKDNVLVTAGLSLFQIDGKFYAKLGLKNSVIRYATDRYVDIEMQMNPVNGLKVPNSAIVEKSFYTIPKEYAVQGGDNNNVSFLLETYDKQGNASQTLITPIIYYSTDTEYYVETHAMNAGANLIKQDSSDRYTVGKTAALKGVYNINKGYAVFKQINVLYNNEEYSIIEEGTTFGLSVYDHIALNGKAVKEDDIIY